MTPMNLALRRQRERIEQVLNVGLGLRLTQLAEYTQVGSVIATPDPGDYFSVLDTRLEEQMSARPVVIQIAPNRETRYDSRMSGTGRAASTLMTVEIGVLVAFQAPAAYDPIMRNGRRLNLQEVIELMGDTYRGAVIDVVLRDAVDGEVITEIFPINDFTDSVVVDTIGTIGRAVMVFEVRTQAQHFTPQYAVARELPLT